MLRARAWKLVFGQPGPTAVIGGTGRLPEIRWSEFRLRCGSWSRALRSLAMILPEVAADLAGIDQPMCKLLLAVPEADLFARQPTGKPVIEGWLRAGRQEQRHDERYMA